MRKFLSKYLIKKENLNSKEWSKKLTKVVESENKTDVQLPILLIDNEIEWEFEVFSNMENLINTSISSHWGGVTPTCTKLDANVIDCKGTIYKIDNDCYNHDWGIGYSYPKEIVGEISSSDLKKIIIYGCKEYIDVFDPDFKQKILQGIKLLNKSSTISDIINILGNELNFENLRNID